MESWEKQKAMPTADFHLDSDITDPAEDLLARLGPDRAIAELEAKLDANSNDTEAWRELTLIQTRLTDLLARISERVSH